MVYIPSRASPTHTTLVKSYLLAIGSGTIFAIARPPAIHSHRTAFCVNSSSVVVLIARYDKSLCFWKVNVHWGRSEEPDVTPVFQKPVSRS